MISNIPKILIFFCLFFNSALQAQEIWRESFTVPNKGIWGGENGTIQSDFSGITNWTLNYDGVKLADSGDYAKTVITSGGRFEVVDITGELVWRSATIDITEYIKVDIKLSASETGSNTNINLKYLKAYYKLDNGAEIPFETNAENLGNWGSAVAEQKGLVGEKLQIVVRMSNDYSADKVILDEVIVIAEEKPLEPIQPGDILISEVLFNPVAGGSDYVEIYNNSGKEISTNRLYLASRDNKLELTQIYPLSKSKRMFLPGNYLALTKDTNGVFPWFEIKCRECFLQMEKFPSYNNDFDYVVLLDENMQVIDELFYSEKMHHLLLAEEKGISLERISFEAKTNDIKNWHSASTTSGYGTPGYQNSQFELKDVSKPKVTFSPEAFSPNFDGYNDEYQINYELEKPGYIANISIFDSAGRFVMKLANNEILGTSGTIVWNGKDETGKRQNLGVYVILVEILNTTGEIYQYKDGVVLTDVLE
ncbi:MAG TPA: gliding motility-associated C-terminal domain-containing protein [Draconibacterium sp.]|nr:gliding motility-associated C-terminal domain-containing protein [Draconibacterium sp.]